MFETEPLQNGFQKIIGQPLGLQLFNSVETEIGGWLSPNKKTVNPSLTGLSLHILPQQHCALCTMKRLGVLAYPLETCCKGIEIRKNISKVLPCVGSYFEYVPNLSPIIMYILASTILSTEPPRFWTPKIAKNGRKRWKICELSFDFGYNLSALIAFGCCQNLDDNKAIIGFLLSALVMLISAVTVSIFLRPVRSSCISRNPYWAMNPLKYSHITKFWV